MYSQDITAQQNFDELLNDSIIAEQEVSVPIVDTGSEADDLLAEIMPEVEQQSQNSVQLEKQEMQNQEIKDNKEENKINDNRERLKILTEKIKQSKETKIKNIENTLDKEDENDDNYSNDSFDINLYKELKERYQELEREKKDLSRKYKSMEIDLQDAQYLIDALKEKAKEYQTKAETAELDAQRDIIPEELKTLVRYYHDSKDQNEKFAKQSEYRFKHELKTMLEKAYWKNLDPYINESTSEWSEVMSWGGIEQYNTNIQYRRNNNSIDKYIESML